MASKDTDLSIPFSPDARLMNHALVRLNWFTDTYKYECRRSNHNYAVDPHRFSYKTEKEYRKVKEKNSNDRLEIITCGNLGAR